MSPLLSDRLTVGLAPARVTLARATGLLRSRITSRNSFECKTDERALGWTGSVATLGKIAEKLRGDRLRVTVVLSNHFVRYTVVPFDGAISGEAEELAYARFHFSRIHGEAAASWDIRLSRSSRGVPRLASAIDRVLLDALRDCFPTSARARLVSVQPLLMSVQNRRVDTAPWLLLVERGRACVASAPGGRWQTVQSMRGDFSAPESWPALLARALLRCDGAEQGEVLVQSSAGTEFPAFVSGRWRFSAAVGAGQSAVVAGAA